MKSSFDTANMFLLCTEAMSCKAIHTHLYIPVTNTHSVKFCFLLLKELQPPCNVFFFQGTFPCYGNKPTTVSSNSPNNSIHAHET